MLTQNEKMVMSLRSYLRNLSSRRTNGTVTADDAHAYLNRRAVRSSGSNRLQFINAALQSGDFERVGQTRSTRPEAKGRLISEWQSAN